MAITRSTKELSATAISCGDSFDVILTLAAEPDITSNPTDIVLILERSGSPDRMCDQRNFRVRFIACYIDAGFTCCTLDD